MNPNQQPQQPEQPLPEYAAPTTQPGQQIPFTPPESVEPAESTFPAAQPVTSAPQENPGQTLGIVSIVMIFVFPLLGIIFGAMSRSKSKAAHMPSGLGTAGLIINIIVTVIGFIVATLFFVFVIAAGSEAIENGTITSSGKIDVSNEVSSAADSPADNAALVAKQAEAYRAKAGDYPKSKRDFATYPESQLPSDMAVFSMLFSNNVVTYLYCGTGSAQVVYLGDSEDDKRITALGTASPTKTCELGA